MAEMLPNGLSDVLPPGATTPSKGRQSPSPSTANRKDTILSLVELLLQQEDTREKGADSRIRCLIIH